MATIKQRLKAFSDKHGNMGDRVEDVVSVISKRAAQFDLLDY